MKTCAIWSTSSLKTDRSTSLWLINVLITVYFIMSDVLFGRNTFQFIYCVGLFSSSNRSITADNLWSTSAVKAAQIYIVPLNSFAGYYSSLFTFAVFRCCLADKIVLILNKHIKCSVRVAPRFRMFNQLRPIVPHKGISWFFQSD